MRRSLFRVISLALALTPPSAFALTIDTFQVQQAATGSVQGPLSFQPGVSSCACSSPIWQGRTVISVGTPTLDAVTTRIGAGSLTLQVSATPEDAQGNVVWSLFPSLDLTSGGAANPAFTFDVLEQTIGAVATIQVQNASSGDRSTASLSLNGPGLYAIPLASFVASTPAPANFSTADQITLMLSSSASAVGDVRIGPLRVVPEPTFALLACAAAFTALAARLANRCAGVGRSRHERAHVARTGGDRRRRRVGVLQAG